MKKTKLLHHRRAGFTITEFMMTMALFTVTMGGVISTYVFGLKMFQVTQAKLGASDDARRTIGRVIDEVHSAWAIRIGQGSLTSFTEITNGALQVGSAIQIYPSSNTNDWIRYYYDTNDFLLKRTEDGMSGAAIMVHWISTNLVFSAEDSSGNVLSNNFNNRVISVNLPVKQFRYPVTLIGPGNYFDSYQLRTRITRRKLE